MPTRPCARFNAPLIPLDVYLLSDNIGLHVRDFVQAQGFLSQQPNLESSATFTSVVAVDLSRYNFQVILSSAAVKESLRFLRYRFKAYLSRRC